VEITGIGGFFFFVSFGQLAKKENGQLSIEELKAENASVSCGISLRV
jgi:hypothetical protein